VFLSITEFFGHFHPLVVHLPIGILLMAVVLHWLSASPKYQAFRNVIPFILVCGMISAVAACISGYLLSISDDYNEDIVGWHKWLGISVALVSIAWYLKERNIKYLSDLKYFSATLFVLIMITGHLGGVLTHGSDYLSGPLADIFSGDESSAVVFRPVPDVQEAEVYGDLVQPILQSKCYGCHGRNKQKGGLRMDDSLRLMEGGKDGVVIQRGNARKSDLVHRITLPIDVDDHMPPREKGQLSENQKELLRWWIENGARFSGKVKDMDQSSGMKAVLVSFQQAAPMDTLSLVPGEPVAKADEKILHQLIERGIMVTPLGRESNYLSANFYTDTLVTDEDLDLLVSLSKQIVRLKIAFTDLKDPQMEKIAQLTNLTKLSLEHTRITDEGLEKLNKCSRLQYLNLVGNEVTMKGVLALKDLKQLRSIYVYQTAIEKSDWPSLQGAFPGVVVDSGGYSVPTLVTDTTKVE
jgi:uncharacterized membrane protein